MPASILLSNGKRWYRPSIQATIDASSLGGKGTSTGNVAVVGSFPSINEADPLGFTSARAVKDFYDDPELQRVAKLCFDPSSDDRVPGGADTLTFVNVTPVTAASYAVVDSSSALAMTLTARLYGKAGGRTHVTLGNGTASATGLDVTVLRDGESEVYTQLESGVVANLQYTGSDLTTSLLTVNPTQWLWTWTIGLTLPASGPPNEITKTLTEIVSAGLVLTLGLVDGGAGAATQLVNVTIIGKDENGATVTEVKPTTAVGATTFVGGASTTKKWSDITSIKVSAGTDTSYNGVLTVTGTAFDIDCVAGSFTTVGQAVSFIDANSNKGFSATAVHVQTNTIPLAHDSQLATGAGGIDKQTNVNVKGVDAVLRADSWAVAEALNKSKFIKVTVPDAADLPSAHHSNNPATSEASYLLGGTETPAVASDWDAALQAIEDDNIQIVVALTDTLSLLQKLSTHCVNAAIQGYERNAWCGCTKDQTLANVKTNFTAKLNTRYVSMVAQEAKITDHMGRAVWVDPKYYALMHAGAQAGTPIGTPLTRKRLRVSDVRQDWKINLDANEGISYGICLTTSDDLGFRVERSVTTYLEDDNPIYSETSAWESSQASVRFLRNRLTNLIGSANTTISASRLRGLTESHLQDQVDGTGGIPVIIKAWRNISIEDLGDRYRISYELAAAEPINFIEVFASVVRIPSV